MDPPVQKEDGIRTRVHFIRLNVTLYITLTPVIHETSGQTYGVSLGLDRNDRTGAPT